MRGRTVVVSGGGDWGEVVLRRAWLRGVKGAASGLNVRGAVLLVADVAGSW